MHEYHCIDETFRSRTHEGLIGIVLLVGISACLEMEVGTIQEPVVVQLPGNVTVPAGDWYTLLSTPPLYPTQDQTVYLVGQVTATGSQGGLNAIRILCPDGWVQNTQNFTYTGTPAVNAQERLVYHPTSDPNWSDGSPVVCSLQVRGSGKTVYANNTFLQAEIRYQGWAWGTWEGAGTAPTLDVTNGVDDNNNRVTIIGPGLKGATSGYSAEEMDLGSTEYVLKGSRFSISDLAVSFNVTNGVQVTCETNNSPETCNVTVQLLIQRMKSPTSSIVCKTTTVTTTVNISESQHHRKVWQSASGLPLNVTCTDSGSGGGVPTGRSYIIKTLATLNDGNDNQDYIVIERGFHYPPSRLTYNNGYSITNVIQNL